ncbi:MAG: rhodanese-like domain-containing protein [Bacteroidota bacterium]
MKWILGIAILSYTACQAQSEGSGAEDDALFQDIDLAEFERIRADYPDAVLLDLRTPEETDAGIIPGAEIVNFQSPNFVERLNQLDRKKIYVVYCASGGRSTRASRQMQEAGFERVYNLKPGYRGWKAAQ